MPTAKTGTSARGLLRLSLSSLSVAGLTTLLMLAGCRKAVQPEPVQKPTRPTPPARGIFHGLWLDGGELFYTIEHQLKSTPIITPASNAIYQTELADVEYRGRKLTFEQKEFPCITGDDDLIKGKPLEFASTGTAWNVVMRVAINDPHRVLCEMTSTSAMITRMLWRDVSEIGIAWQKGATTNIGLDLIQDLSGTHPLGPGQVTRGTGEPENPGK